MRTVRILAAIAALLAPTACSDRKAASPTLVQAASPAAPSSRRSQLRRVRSTGTVRAVQTLTVTAPQISGQNGRLTLTRVIPNGVTVKKDDVLATFDRTQPADEAREFEAKVDELKNQIEQKRAENRAAAAKRVAEMREAEAEIAKARIQLSKGPVVSEIDRAKAEVRVETATQRIASLKVSHAHRERTEAAGLRILELKRDRQQVGLERSLQNLERLVIKAPIGGMVALTNNWRNGTFGPAQEGDQVFPGRPLLMIFDPGRMVVETQINQADGAVLVPGTRAKVRLDAYSSLVFDAVLEFSSPVASAAFDSPIRIFPARFRVEQTDPRLLPDLSAAVDIEMADEGNR